MAVPFFIPDESESSANVVVSSATSSTVNSVNSTPTRPIPIPQRNNVQSPPQSPIDNEMLVQAFYEALCRCSQGSPGFPLTPMSTSPSSGQIFFPRHGQFFGPSPSGSAYSSPRHSFRVPRRRLNSHGSYTQDSDGDDEDESQWNELENHYTNREQLDEFPGRVPQPKNKKKSTESNQKPKDQEPTTPSSSKNKITTFVISALQFVIDTLR